ncbi:hypothetical protein [Rhodococcus sp. Q]|uniref:hypothetical protein n=1 Tax=Rhodococcus sp. Q TaxID=2502252 RepID=UPI0010F75EAC|nr:hypothetical protein [Rhodococcus sp. Q]
MLAAPALLVALAACGTPESVPAPTTQVSTPAAAPASSPTLMSSVVVSPPAITPAAAELTPPAAPEVQPPVNEAHFVHCLAVGDGATLLSDGTTGYSPDCVAEKTQLPEIPPPAPAPAPDVPPYVEPTPTTVEPYRPTGHLPAQHGYEVMLGGSCTPGSTGHTSDGISARCVPVNQHDNGGYIWEQ